MALLIPVRVRRVVAAAAAWLAFCAPVFGTRQEGVEGEHAVKAAFLYNFTKFVDWPASAFAGTSDAFRVCAFADSPFERELETMLAGETVRGRPLRIMKADPQTVRTCHLVYFGPRQQSIAARVLPGLQDAPILTVGEGARFLDQGGAIAFVLEHNRVRFDVSLPAATRAGLAVSSKLLRVARQIDKSTAP